MARVGPRTREGVIEDMTGTAAPGAPRGTAAGITGADVVISILVAFNFAVAGPVFDLLARNLEVFTTRSAPRGDIIGLVALLTLVGPLVLGLGAWTLYRVRRRLGVAVHGVLLAGLLALLGMQLLERSLPSALPPGVLAGVALAGGTAVAVAYYRSAGIRSFARLGVVAPVGFAALFVFFTPARSLLTTAEASDGAQVGNPMPIAIAVFDGLPLVSLLDAGRDVDAQLYPNFARLSRHATWFRNATTPSAKTKHALPAMLTGRYRPEGSAVATDFPDNLFTLLAPTYRIVAYEPVSALCPEEHCADAPRSPRWSQRWSALSRDVGLLGLHAVLPGPAGAWLPPPEDAVGELAGGRPRHDPEEEDGKAQAWEWFLEELAPDRRPVLYYVHALKPHFPWYSLPSGQHGIPPDKEPHGGYVHTTWDDDWVNVAQWQRHLLQTGYVDFLLGQFLDALEDAGVYDDALVVVTSDHGEAFTPGTRVRVPSAGNLGELAFVPLFVKEPGQQEGRTVDQPVELTDVYPTVVDLVDVRGGPEAGGHSLLGALPDRRARSIEGWEARESVSPRGDEVEAPLRRKVELFGSDGGWERLFRVGPHGDLAGRDVSDVRVGSRSDVRIGLREGDRLRRVDPRASQLPVFLGGRVTGGTGGDEPIPLAAAVNGRIATVVETYRHHDGSIRVFVVLPAEALERGHNDLELFEIDAGAGRVTLRPIGVTGS